MTAQAKRTTGGLLVLVAVVLTVVAMLLWQQASDDAEADRLAARYAEVISGTDIEADDADRTAPLAVAGLAAVLFVGGVIFLATTRADDD